MKLASPLEGKMSTAFKQTSYAYPTIGHLTLYDYDLFSAIYERPVAVLCKSDG